MSVPAGLRRLVLVVLALAAPLALPGGPFPPDARAQEESPKTGVVDFEATDERLNQIMSGEAEVGPAGNSDMPPAGDAGTSDPAVPIAPVLDALDGPTKESYFAALRGYYDYRLSGYGHRNRVFTWQLFSSRVIFWTVLALVVAGVYFAAVQFHSGLRRRARGDEPRSEHVTEFAASLGGIKVTSPVLGVIILVISLAFFYLYLVYVYPIENIF
jgi:hypothetical protein